MVQVSWRLSVVSALLSMVQAQYTVQKTYDSSNFFEEFYFRSAEYYEDLIGKREPTDGATNYLDKEDAISSGLASVSNGQVRLAVDSSNVVDVDVGRSAVRLESKATFDKGLLIADITHMPKNSCGTWPAFWTFNFAEDPYGEVDILEGTAHMGQSSNYVSLHSCGTCSFQGLGGIGDDRPNCDLCGTPDNDSGCGIEANLGTYGEDFNAVGGGIYATLFADEGLTIWFFRRDQIPDDLKSGSTANPEAWEIAPMVQFKSGSTCNTNTYFKKQTIIINTTFCGNSIWNWELQAEGQCGPTNGDGPELCASYVANHPQDYEDAYWAFNSIKLYQQV